MDKSNDDVSAENVPSCWIRHGDLLVVLPGFGCMCWGGGLTELGQCVSLPLMACHNVKCVELKLGFG